MTERGSQAVHRVLQLLHLWTREQPSLSLTAIAKAAGLTVPTAHRMLQALQRERFLVRDSVTAEYSLGPAIMDLAGVVLQRADQDELVMVALPRLERLRMVTGETVGLHVPVGDSRMCVAELVSQAPIRAATGVGRMYDLPLGAAGKVLVAWSPGRLDMTVARLRPPDGGRRLRQEAAQVRRKGHAVSSGETIAGASAMSVPIYSSTGDVCAAVNVTGPANRWTRTSMAEHRASIDAEARAISALLGHDG